MMFATYILTSCLQSQYLGLDGYCYYYGNIISPEICGYNAQMSGNECSCKFGDFTDPIFAGCTACSKKQEDQIGMFGGQCQCHDNFAWDSTLADGQQTCVVDCGDKPFYKTEQQVKVCVNKCITTNCSCEKNQPTVNGRCSSCAVQVDGKCTCPGYIVSKTECIVQSECETQINYEQCSCQGFVYDTFSYKCILTKDCTQIISIHQKQCITEFQCKSNKGQVNDKQCVCNSSSGWIYNKINNILGSKCMNKSECQNITGDTCYSFNSTGKCASPLLMNINQTACVFTCQENEMVSNDQSSCVCMAGFTLNSSKQCMESPCAKNLIDLSGNKCVDACGTYQQEYQQRCVCISGYSASADLIICYKQTKCAPGQILSVQQQCVDYCSSNQTLNDDYSACVCVSGTIVDPSTNSCHSKIECSYFRGTSCDDLGSRSCPYFYVDQQLKRTCTLTCPSAVRNQMCVQNIPQNKNGANIGVIIPVIVVPIVIAVVVVFVLFRFRKPVEVKAKAAEKMKVTVGQPVNSYI
ncbi:Conserved_hypothetical protein [Hexamita inflata]|uniref:Uncharacterized protein n=1 Tax=Hexamita inflata TaxID=28002 RepID=A0ABP1I781_9EUKA